MGRCAGLFFVVIAVLSPSLVHAALYTVSAGAYAGINLQSTRETVGPIEQLFGVSVSAVMETNTQAWAQADYGSLRVAAYGEYNSTNHSGYSDATATVFDTLTVTGPAGTPVDLKFSYKVHGMLSSSRTSTTATDKDAWGSGRLQVNSNQGTFDSGFWSWTGTVSYRWSYPLPASDTVTAILHTTVGDTVTVEYMLNAHTFTSAPPTGGETVLASANFGNTATLQIESLTSGASFTAASGTAYVPEPTSAGIVLLTTWGLIRRRPTASKA